MTINTPESKISFRHDVLLAFQVALLGMVVPSLRGVTVNWDTNEISALCFYDGPINDEKIELTSEIETEVMAGFPDHEVRVTAERCDFPEKLNPKTMKAWVYRRFEVYPE